MPSIDLARLRKQVARLADFFFVPDEFVIHLHSMLDSYVDYTVRRQQATAPGLDLRTYRTPPVVMRQIEQELSTLATTPENRDSALDLADRLWDEAWLETRLLAAFLIGSIPPQEEQLMARLTAWAGQVRDPRLRAELLNRSLIRMRKQAPAMFLDLLGEWLRPERPRFWRDGIQAAISAASDPDFINLPPLLDVVRPVIEEAPSTLQMEIESFVLALFEASPTETKYFLRQVLIESKNPMTAITFRRISPAFPAELKEEVREFIRGKPFSES